MKKRRNIFKPISSKKVATLLSASLLMLPLTACREQNVEKPHIEIEFCDTSDIRLDTYLNNYLVNYEKGYVNNGIEMYNHYEELYEILSQKEIVLPEESQYCELKNKNVTYNFNKELMNYDKKDTCYYYANDEKIKTIFSDTVELKTIDGTIKIDKDESSYIITNKDEPDSIKTVVQYNQDGSYKVIEETNSKSETLEFNKDGFLELSLSHEFRDPKIKKVYKKGDINIYDEYRGEDLIKKVNLDGTYFISEYNNGIDKSRYDFYPDSRVSYDKITYFYDQNNYLQKIEAYEESLYNTNHYSEDKIIFLPNGDYYEYIKTYDENNKLYKDEKIENKYNKHRTNVISKKNEDGNFDQIITRYDYNAISPDKMLGIKGDWIFKSVNGKVVITQKDGIIYNYNEKNEEFVKAYNVEKDGVTYYNEDAKKIEFKSFDGIIMKFDENEKIDYIDNGIKRISYYDYDKNLISSISNCSENEITVEGNDKNFKLSSTGNVSFYENGNPKHYCYDEKTMHFYYENGVEWQFIENGTTTYYDENHNINVIIKDGVRTEYYDYDNNIIESFEENGIRYTYYEYTNIDERKIRKIENFGKEEVYTYDGYDLKKGSSISYYENGQVDYYNYDENNSVKFQENGKHNYEIKDGKKYCYDSNDKIIGVWDDSVFTGFHDFEKQQISEIRNAKKDGTIISINDVYGNVYDLKEDESINFYENGNLHYVKYNDGCKKCYRKENQNYYYIKNEKNNTCTFYYKDQVLHVMELSEKFITTDKDGTNRIELADGTIIDSDEVIEQIENDIKENDEER